ncbi:MAG: hypothetical protein H8E14_18450 [Candidatus Marinimicrobia bacterium]|nr:hypothetical protein [Candidatus Neomarinimicrobiota bacterium]
MKVLQSTWWHLVFLLVVLCFMGCIRSLHPLYTEEDLVFSTDLIGTWVDKENNIWTFIAAGENSYSLIFSEEGEPAQFESHLVKLGAYLFLDTYPEEPSINNDFYNMHLIGAHLFAKMEIYPDSCIYTLMDHEWLKNILSESIENLAYEMVDDTIILTANTAELQTLFKKYADDPEAFKDRTLLLRHN